MLLIRNHCKKEFKPQRTNKKNPQKHCGRECAVDARRKQKDVINCIQCGNETANTKFCSRSCSATYNNLLAPKRTKVYKNTCKTCGTPTNNKHWCNMACRPSPSYKEFRSTANERWARYIAKRNNQTPVNEDIKALQEFYKTCPDGFEVDHIIPISKGGLHTLSNLQYLTPTENKQKSNKLNWHG